MRQESVPVEKGDQFIVLPYDSLFHFSKFSVDEFGPFQTVVGEDTPESSPINRMVGVLTRGVRMSEKTREMS